MYLGINGIKRGVKIDPLVLILNSLWVYVGDDDTRQWSEFWRFVRRKPSCEKITVKNKLQWIAQFHICENNW
jgi:hypothetical protein